MIPSLTMEDLKPGRSGVRALLLNESGDTKDDFRIEYHGNSIHVLNAPSPAATASLAIGGYVADEAEKHFEEALKINENLPDAYNGVGLLYYAREEYADAARQFNRASRLAPDNQTFSANVEAALSFLNEKVREEIMKEFAWLNPLAH